MASAIDGKQNTGWGIAGAIGKSHSAVFTMKEAPVIKAGTVLAFALSQQFTDGRHSIGKFRLVVEQEVQDVASEKSSREALGKDSKKSRQ